MDAIEIRGHAGELIRSFNDWETHAMPPDRKLKHWKEGRSAFELGRIWMEKGEPCVPAEFLHILESHTATRGTVIGHGITEHETILPFGNRGPRCHDLALYAVHNGSGITICIEAKADESFGGTVAEELLKARKRPATRFPERLDWLTRSLLGVPAFNDEGRAVLSDVISGLPYQLFSAIAGTLLEAEINKATKAVLVVHEFRTALTTDAKMEANASALDGFLRLLLAKNGSADANFRLERGQLFGSVSIIDRATTHARKMPSHIPLLIGKIRTDRIASGSD